MYSLRLNDVLIQVKGQTVTIFDVFGDMSAQELDMIIAYLVDENFINEKKDVNVRIKSKSFISISKKKEGQAQG